MFLAFAFCNSLTDEGLTEVLYWFGCEITFPQMYTDCFWKNVSIHWK